MLEIHAFATPNSVKVAIAAEEMGLPHSLVPVDLRQGKPRSDAFPALNPNGKVPVLIDRSPAGDADLVLSESAAILVYLAEKTGQLLPVDPERRGKVFEQLFFHASAASPAFLQAFLLEMRKAPEGDARTAARKWNACSAFSTAPFSTTLTSRATSTRSPTSPISDGSGATKPSARTSPRSRPLSAGTTRSCRVRRSPRRSPARWRWSIDWRAAAPTRIGNVRSHQGEAEHPHVRFPVLRFRRMGIFRAFE